MVSVIFCGTIVRRHAHALLEEPLRDDPTAMMLPSFCVLRVDSRADAGSG